MDKNGNMISAFDPNGLSILYLAAPTLKSATASDGAVTTKWSRVGGAESYTVFRKTMGGSWKKLGVTEDTSYTDTAVKSGTAYLYTVRAYSGDTRSACDTTGLIQAAWSDTSLLTYYGPDSSRPTYIDGEMYLITQSGKMLKGRTVTLLDKTWTVDKNGVITGYVTDVMRTAAERLDSIGWNLKAAFNYCVGYTYYGRWMRAPDGEVHSTWYADYGFTNHKGNCYVMNASLYQFERVMGFDCYFIEGYVKSSSTYNAPHGWTEVVLDGDIHVFDANFTNETGVNGYDIYYGKSGTWRYTDYTRVD